MKEIAVIGAGTMGNGIAHVFAQFGYNVQLVDINSQFLMSAIKTIEKNLARQVKKEVLTQKESEETLGRIKTVEGIDSIKPADIVIEAATENEKVKKEIFVKLDDLMPDKTILATNTSSISITEIAAVTSRPEKVIGMHFMNLVPLMKLIEIVRGLATSDQI